MSVKSLYETLFEDQRGFELAIKSFGEKQKDTSPVYRAIFPDKRILNTSFDAIVSGNNVAVAAAVTGWNTSSPLTGDEAIAKKHIENLVIQRGKRRTEHELHEIEILKATQETSILAQQFYDDVTFAKDAVNLGKNALTYSLLSDGKATYTNVNNEGGVSGVVIDYGLNASQRVDAATTWDTVATADPVADIQGIVRAGLLRGDIYRFLWMTRETFNKMAATTKMQAAVVGMPLSRGKNAEFATQTLGLEDVNAYLLRMDLPIINIIDGKIRVQNANGGVSVVDFWATDIVHFATDLVQGTMNYNTPIEEKNPNYSKTAFIGNLDGVTIKQSYTDDPVEEKTIGKSICAPAWNNAGSCVLLDATP